MGTPVQEAKRALRQQIGARLEGMAEAERLAASATARARLAQQTIWKDAQTILVFAPMPAELDIWPSLVEALAAGKTVALPRFERGAKSYIACRVRDPASDVGQGYFGIREPTDSCTAVPFERLELILVPGLAFDLQGHRLGRGRGYYDRILAASRGVTCGVAFDQQLVDNVPVAAHDKTVDFILTPTRWISR